MGRKRVATPARSWLITVYDGVKAVSELRVAAKDLTDGGLDSLLQTLAVKYGLGDSEIAASYMARRARGRADHLNVRRSRHPTHTPECGQNPHVVAVLVDD